MPSLVMTLIGEDRPGLVESLAAIVADHDANWLESRMTHMAGHFAGILRIEVAEDRVDALVDSLERLDKLGLTVTVQKDESVATDTTEHTASVQLDLVGSDRPGIVREVAHVLTELSINVEDIQTDCRMAPMSGGELFHATAKLRLPAGRSLADLRSRLEEIADDLMVDIRVEETDS